MNFTNHTLVLFDCLTLTNLAFFKKGSDPYHKQNSCLTVEVGFYGTTSLHTPTPGKVIGNFKGSGEGTGISVTGVCKRGMGHFWLVLLAVGLNSLRVWP